MSGNSLSDSLTEIIAPFRSALVFVAARLEDFVLAAIARGGSSETALLPENGSLLLLREAERELERMTQSLHSHRPRVDEEHGIYEYDCSGFVGYALKRADPGAFRALLHRRPTAGNFYYHLIRFGPEPGPGGWIRIAAPADLRPGDVIAWLRPPSSRVASTGHVMIVAEEPVENPARKGEFLVRVIDATRTPHSGDSRGRGRTGLGTGTIGIMTDSPGRPTGYFWRGGETAAMRETKMVFARIV